MSRKTVLEDVSKRRLLSMRAIMRRRIASYARNNGYEIQTWVTPLAAESLWRITLKKRGKVKTKLDFMARVSHDAKNKRLTIALLRMPVFIRHKQALAQVKSIYQATG